MARYLVTLREHVSYVIEVCASSAETAEAIATATWNDSDEEDQRRLFSITGLGVEADDCEEIAA